MRKKVIYLLLIMLTGNLGIPVFTYATEASSKEPVRVIVQLAEESLIERLSQNGESLDEKTVQEVNQLIDEIDRNKEEVEKEIMNEVDSAEIEESFSVVLNGFALMVNASDIDELSDMAEVKAIYPSTVISRPAASPQLVSSKELIAAPSAGSSASKGEGVVVAVIDTGIDYTHKDFVLSSPSAAKLSQSSVEQSVLNQRVAPGRYFTAKVPFGYNYMDRNTEVRDLAPNASMHGMHVAGIIGANGAEGFGGLRGMAPETQLLAMKVFSNSANSNYTYSDIYIKAMDDAVRLGADVINMSIGDTAAFSATNGPEYQAIERARESGAVVTISAGNSALYGEGKVDILASNPDYGMVSSPAIAENSLAVASFENSRINNQPNPNAAKMSDFSSWGLGANLDLKPEVTAPGGGIVSTINNNQYAIMSGTSMAAPHVTGAAAILVSKAAALGVTGRDRTNYIEALLMNSSRPVKNVGNQFESPRRQGAGLIHISNALQSQVTVVEKNNKKGKLNLGEMNVGVVSKEVTITNHGPSTLQFTLSSSFQTDSVRNLNGRKVAVPTEPVQLSNQQVAMVSGSQLTVGPNESVSFPVSIEIKDVSTVKAQLPNGFYLDGFLQFTSPTHVPLTIPISGFVGDWDQAPVFDQDYFESESLWKKQGLKNDYGQMVQPKEYLLSPNNDGLYERISPVYSLLRNAKRLEFSIVDASGNRVVLLNSRSNVVKHYSSTNSFTDLTAAAWDGRRQGAPVPDGTYYYQMKALIDYTGAEWQVKEYPLIVDTTAPATTLSYDFNQQLLTVATVERGAGVAEYSVYKNGGLIAAQSNLAKIPISTMAGDVLRVETRDKAGNRSSVELVVKEPIADVVAQPTPTPTPTPNPNPENKIVSVEDIAEQLKNQQTVELTAEKELLIEKEVFEEVFNKKSTLELTFAKGTVLFDTKTLGELSRMKQGLLKITVSEIALSKGTQEVAISFYMSDGTSETELQPFESAIHVKLPLLVDITNSTKTALYLLEGDRQIYQGGKIENGILDASIYGSGTYGVIEKDITFEDTNKHWAKMQIETLASRSIIQGKSEKEFMTNASITRAEFAVLLTRALNLPTQGYRGIFNDVPASKSWAYRGVEAAYQAGIVNGITNDQFNPDARITRQEIATMIMRAVRYQDESKINNLNVQHQFTDVRTISSFAKESVKQANSLGIIQGRAGNMFDPKANATRAEAAVMLYRSLLVLDEF
ncbi:S8 family serine peptidase [Chryseomicrobium palamuruense]|uniref:S8 family serine peptidase n=1 Tax=Chryseomicrobium palamuruense TaxID=682973 RepID=A0ABV8UUZ2_9BACL